jgi:two-component system, OmpR family, response regulator
VLAQRGDKSSGDGANRSAAIIAVVMPAADNAFRATQAPRRKYRETKMSSGRPQDGVIGLSMMQSPHVLLVEDDPEIRKLVSQFLQSNGIRIATSADGREMDQTLKDNRIDLLVLDIMLPGEDGLSICRRLRALSNLPVIMLTAKGEDIDRIIGLEIGADDYLTKPFNPRELLARIRAVLRRGASDSVSESRGVSILTFDGWRLDPNIRQLHDPDGARVALTGAEFDLLFVFCERPRRVLSRDQLIDLTQGRSAAPFERSIDVLVSRLRQKMEKEPKDPRLIQTIRSGGYMFSPAVEVV